MNILYISNDRVWIMKKINDMCEEKDYIDALKEQDGCVITLNNKIYNFLLNSIFKNSELGYDALISGEKDFLFNYIKL